MKIYEQIASQVTATIKQYGQAIKVTTLTGSTTNTYGVWGESTNEEVSDGMTGNVTIRKRKLYVPYIKVEPEVGGTVTVNKVDYAINSVTLYKPTDLSVGFCIEVIA